MLIPRTLAKPLCCSSNHNVCDLVLRFSFAIAYAFGVVHTPWQSCAEGLTITYWYGSGQSSCHCYPVHCYPAHYYASAMTLSTAPRSWGALLRSFSHPTVSLQSSPRYSSFLLQFAVIALVPAPRRDPQQERLAWPDQRGVTRVTRVTRTTRAGLSSGIHLSLQFRGALSLLPLQECRQHL